MSGRKEHVVQRILDEEVFSSTIERILRAARSNSNAISKADYSVASAEEIRIQQIEKIRLENLEMARRIAEENREKRRIEEQQRIQNELRQREFELEEARRVAEAKAQYEAKIKAEKEANERFVKKIIDDGWLDLSFFGTNKEDVKKQLEGKSNQEKQEIIENLVSLASEIKKFNQVIESYSNINKKTNAELSDFFKETSEFIESFRINFKVTNKKDIQNQLSKLKERNKSIDKLVTLILNSKSEFDDIYKDMQVVLKKNYEIPITALFSEEIIMMMKNNNDQKSKELELLEMKKETNKLEKDFLIIYENDKKELAKIGAVFAKIREISDSKDYLIDNKIKLIKERINLQKNEYIDILKQKEKYLQDLSLRDELLLIANATREAFNKHHRFNKEVKAEEILKAKSITIEEEIAALKLDIEKYNKLIAQREHQKKISQEYKYALGAFTNYEFLEVQNQVLQSGDEVIVHFHKTKNNNVLQTRIHKDGRVLQKLNGFRQIDKRDNKEKLLEDHVEFCDKKEKYLDPHIRKSNKLEILESVDPSNEELIFEEFDNLSLTSRNILRQAQNRRNGQKTREEAL